MIRGHPRSSAMSSFDRAHTISYSSLIETMHLVPFSIYGELFVEIRQPRPTPPAFGAPVVKTRSNCEKNWVSEN